MQTKLTFFKTQKPCLESALQNKDQVVFATELPSGSYKYASFSTQEEYANHILAGSVNCNELLRGETHTFFDIDAKCSLTQLGFTKEEFVSVFSKLIQECFQTFLSIKVKKKQLRWSDSCRETKTSFHLVVVLEDYFWSDRTQLKNFVEKIREKTLKTQGFYTFVEKDNCFLRKVLSTAKFTRKTGCFAPSAVAKSRTEFLFFPTNRLL